ncbi:MAG: 30S ribosomal protein S1 [Bacillota bacterium]|nr:30S ribosomal protein S1 [Bacillota bacterium]
MISDTICNATSERQTEAADIASQADMVFVVGSRGSSNTKKLYEVCGGLCTETYLIENASELPLGHIKNAAIKKSDLVIGVCAGASTPAYIIKEAIYKMEEIKNELESEKSFAEALEESLITLNTGDRVRGTVIGITPTEVQVNLGTKQAAYIPVSELTSDPNAKVEDIVKVGDEVEVFVTRVNDADGVITLSKRKADAIKGLEELGKAVEEDTIFEGKVAETLERGVVIYHNGVRVFIPASHCPVARDASLADMAGKTFRFKIIQFDKRKNKIIGSIRNVLREERKAAEEAVWADIAVDKRYKGKVKSLTSYGAFVDIGGVDGMVHISELAWGKIKHPANVVKVGDEIEVYVKELDPEKKRISLGYKDLIENPWEKLKNTYKVGDTVKATVVRLVPFGAFAEVIPGVDGLIHISQIANKRIEHPSSELSVGQEVDAKILDIDLENMKVSLSIRALLEPEVVTEGEKE